MPSEPARAVDPHRESCAQSHRRLLALAAGVDDDAVRAASRLPGWTVAHVLTHLARNADSHQRALEAAGRGEVVARYPGGNAQRDSEIEAGADRPVAELLADLAVSIERLEGAWASASERAWAGHCRNGEGVAQPVADLPFLRWREVECHAVDLGLGATPDDWPSGYVDEELRRATAALGPLPSAAQALDPPTRAAWVMGRVTPAGLTPVGQWY